MFSLSPAGRHNLEAICVELERAAQHYPALYHQQLKPWSVKGAVSITERQWAAFIENEGLSDDSWCEWHGPFEDFLGIWYGSPEGIDRFRDLSDSLRVVLRREDFSDVDSFDLPRNFDSSHGLLTTLHQWGLKFQLPLLRCFIDVWNADGGDDDAEGFVRLTQTWGGVGDVQYPLHPIVNFLRDDVFTSSLAAVRALLRPDLVIDTNEPWPLSNPMAIGNKHAAEEENSRTREQANDKPSDNHRILETPTKWCILLAGSDIPITPANNAGLARIAGLIENCPNTLTQAELFEYGKRPTVNLGRATWRTANAKAEHLEPNKYRKQYKDDAEQRSAAEEEFNSISEEMERARKNGDQAAVSRLQEELAALVKQFNFDDEGKVQKQRAFRDRNEKRQQDANARTISNTLKELRDSDHSQIADELQAQVDYVKGLFTPIDGLTGWRVVRLN